MNIFYLHSDPQTCAAYHCDKHVVKMILETTQLLSTTHWETGGEGPYKSTHKNHPSALWVRESVDHYNWLCELGLALCQEYTARYGKTHKCEEHLLKLNRHTPELPSIGWTEPPRCMPDLYKQKDTQESYRAYYIGDKSSFARWKNGNVPKWFNVDGKHRWEFI